jgi:2-polyprenyl-3-methyl-5-hydroxy-6-metoxy-1,4-benzoquinol methylase
MPQSAKSEHVNNTFFDGYYKNIWRQVFPEKTTLAEVDFIINEANLSKGDRVLDIMCGYGRHSLGLARGGMNVTAVDNLSDYVNEIREKNKSENLNIDALCENVLELQIDQTYDVAICMGNSLQFFNEEDTMRLLSSVSSHLKPGGKFLINTWSISEIVIKQFTEKGWGRFNDLLFFSENKYLLRPSRIETTSVIIPNTGEREEKITIDYIFSINELESMLNKTGFRLKEIYSIPGKKIFTIGDPRAYFVAEKR